MIENQFAKEYLNYFVNSNNPNFAVMLKGKWGVGKTYFIKGIIEEWNNQQTISENEINLRPIYISLNGTSTKREVIELIKAQIYPFLYSKGIKFTSDIFKGFLKSTLKIDFDYDNDGISDGNLSASIDPISIFKSSNDKIKGNRIIIFDDIERCKIPIDEVYGLINDFVEHSQCKVILISHEEKLEEFENNSKYKYTTFKEKIIGQTFEINPDTEKAIDFFLESVKSDIKSHLMQLRTLIIDFFNASKKGNLRVLERAIYDFERLIQFTNQDLKENQSKYRSLIKNFLSYFLIYFLEIKTGNQDITSFQQHSLGNSKEKKYTHYEELVSSLSLYHSTKLFTPHKLQDYIENGNFNAIIYEINNSIIFAKSREERDWEKLWYWQILEDHDFLKLLENVSNRFFHSETFFITEILHITGILLSLTIERIFIEKNKDEIIERAKYLIEKADFSEINEKTKFSSLIRGSWNKLYAASETSEFKSLAKYLEGSLENQKREKSMKDIEDIFYDLTNDNVKYISSKVKEYSYNLGGIIERTPMLSTLDVEKFSEVIFKLNNNALYILIDFFESRFFPEKLHHTYKVEEFQRQEKEFLTLFHLKIVKEARRKSDNNLPIREYTLNQFAEMIKKAIDKL